MPGNRKRTWSRLRVLSSDSEEEEDDGNSLSSSDDGAADQEAEDRQKRKTLLRYKIPKRDTTTPWSPDEIINFKKKIGQI
jgi:hypothetical protein